MSHVLWDESSPVHHDAPWADHDSRPFDSRFALIDQRLAEFLLRVLHRLHVLYASLDLSNPALSYVLRGFAPWQQEDPQVAQGGLRFPPGPSRKSVVRVYSSILPFCCAPFALTKTPIHCYLRALTIHSFGECIENHLSQRALECASRRARAEIKTRPCGREFPGGEGGIRTLGGHEAHNGFRDRPIQPLWHLPKKCHVSGPASDLLNKSDGAYGAAACHVR